MSDWDLMSRRSTTEGKDKDAASPLSDWVNVQVVRSKWGSGIATNLAQADLKLKPAEYIALMFFAALGVGALAWYFGGRLIFSGMIGAVIGLFLPKMYVGRQKDKTPDPV